MDIDARRSPAEYRHVYEFFTRFGDLDPQGHVNNCTFLGYLQDARLEMLHSDPVRKGETPVRGMVVARHEIAYRRPLDFGVEPRRVETWVTQVRTASFTLAYEVRDDEHLYADATTSMVAFDVAGARPRRFTPQEREFIARYLASP